MIKRELYLNHLRQFIDKPQIKILTGIRRSGKSSILLLLKQELIHSHFRSIYNFGNSISPKKITIYIIPSRNI